MADLFSCLFARWWIAGCFIIKKIWQVMWQALAPKTPESKVRLVGPSAYWPYCHIGAQREIFSETGDSCRDSWGRFCRGPHLHKHSRPSCPADTSVPPPMEAPYGRKWGDLWDLKSDQKVLFGYTTYMDSCFQLGASCLFFWSFYFMFFPPRCRPWPRSSRPRIGSSVLTVYSFAAMDTSYNPLPLR